MPQRRQKDCLLMPAHKREDASLQLAGTSLGQKGQVVGSPINPHSSSELTRVVEIVPISYLTSRRNSCS